MTSHVVYAAIGTTRVLKTPRHYVGLTTALPGETAQAAVAKRVAAHASADGPGAFWLKLCDGRSISANVIEIKQSAREGRVAELLHFVQKFGEVGFAVRGACFCERVLGPSEIDLIRRVDQSREDRKLLRDLLRDEPRLQRHVADQCFSCGLMHLQRNCPGVANPSTCSTSTGFAGDDVQCVKALQARSHFLAALSKDPAEFQYPGGPYWHERHQHWEKEVRLVGSQGRLRAKKWYYGTVRRTKSSKWLVSVRTKGVSLGEQEEESRELAVESALVLLLEMVQTLEENQHRPDREEPQRPAKRRRT